MANKRISAFVEKLALTASDFFAVDKASEADTKKIAASYFTDQFSDMQNILGAKNLLKNNLATQTVSGLTITAHSDGSFTVNGTSTANVNINLITNFILKAGEYILSGVGTDAPSNTVYITIAYSSTEAGCNKDNSQKHFTLANDTTITKVYFYCNSGVTFSNYKLYPMIRPASVVDSTFVPYAETNKQLTDDVTDINQALSNKQNKDWSLIDYKDGSTPMTIINNKSEYYLSVNIEKADIFVDTIIIPNLFITSERQFRFGYWGINNSAGAIVKIQKNNDNTITLLLSSASRDNSSVTSTSRLTVYAR